MTKYEIMDLIHGNTITYTSEELANKLHTRIETIHALRKHGLIQAIKLGRSFIYSYKDVLKFLDDYKGCELDNPEMMVIAKINKERGLTL